MFEGLTFGVCKSFSSQGMELLQNTGGPVLCMEYMSVSLLGSCCTLVVYSIPIPGLHDTRAIKSCGAAFSEIAEGCALLVKEATEAPFFSGDLKIYRLMTCKLQS